MQLQRTDEAAAAIQVRVEVATWLGFEPGGRQQTELQRHVVAKVNAMVHQLGVPAGVSVDVASLDFDSATDFLCLYVNGSRCLYSHDLVERVFCVERGLLWTSLSRATLLEWLRSTPGGELDLAHFLARVCEEAIKLTPGVLLGPRQLQVYRERLGERAATIADVELGYILSTVLQQWLSIGNTQVIGEHLVDAARSSDEIAETLIDILSAATIEIQLSAESLHAWTTANHDANVFALLRDGLFYELGLRMPDFKFVAVTDMPIGTFAFKTNDLSGLTWQGLASRQRAVNLSPQSTEFTALSGALAIRNPGNYSAITVCDVDSVGDMMRSKEGLVSWEPLGYLVLCLSNELRARAPKLIHHAGVKAELDRLELVFPKLVQAARARYSNYQVTGVLRLLLAEEISVRSLSQILTSLIDFDYIVVETQQLIIFDPRLPTVAPPAEAWQAAPANLTASVRTALKRYISHKYTRGANTLLAYLLAPDIESTLANTDSPLATQAWQDAFHTAVRDEIGELLESSSKPVILTTVDVRLAARALLCKEFPRLPVLAYQELAPDLNIQSLGRISLS